MGVFDDDFLQELLATFREEAREYLQLIGTGLAELGSGGDPPEDTLEIIYRTVHSLKGASRSVNMTDIETLCQEIESIFSQIRSHDLQLTTDACETLQVAIDLMAELVDGAGEIVVDPDRYAGIVEAVRSIPDGSSLTTVPLTSSMELRAVPAPPPVVTSDHPEPPTTPEPPAPEPPAPEPPTPEPPAPAAPPPAPSPAESPPPKQEPVFDFGSELDEFTLQLREAFKAELQEHLQSISSGLEQLGTGDGADIGDQLDSIHRSAHSLKGASRAVRWAEIESVCMALEDQLGALKRGEADLTPQVTEILHQAVDRMFAFVELTGDDSDAENAMAGTIRDEVSMLLGTVPEASTDTSLAGEQSTSLYESISTPTPSAPPVVAPPTAAPPAAAPPAAAPPVAAPPAAPPLAAPPPQAAAPAQPPTPAKKAPAPREPAVSAMQHADTIRVSTERLGQLLLQAEEMLALKIEFGQLQDDLQAMSDEFEELRELPAERDDDELRQLKALDDASRRLTGEADRYRHSLHGMVDRLLEDMKQVLMLPFSWLLDPFPRMVREISRSLSKPVDIEIRGSDVEIDKRLLEEMKDPLIHLVRNCIGHGIESPEARQAKGKSARGKIVIAITQRDGNNVEMVVQDDGGGVDLERLKRVALAKKAVDATRLEAMDQKDILQLMFESDVSTAKKVDAISGRGLGMAIVRDKVDRLGGTVRVDTESGMGTSFYITLPLTLATFRGVLVEVGGYKFLVPSGSVDAVLRRGPTSVKRVEGRDVISYREELVRLVPLHRILELPAAPYRANAVHSLTLALILVSQGENIAVTVDSVVQEQEVLFKGLGKQLARVRNVAGATVLGNGTVVPILNVTDCIQSARIGGRAGRTIGATEEARPVRVLAVEDSITSRMLIKNVLESSGYHVSTAVNGAEGLGMLSANDFDLVVSDVEMPQLDGIQLTARIRASERLKHLPVILVTGLEREEDRERAMEAGADAYVVKSSFRQGNFLDVVHRYAAKGATT